MFAGAFLVPGASWMLEAPKSINPWAYVESAQRWGVSVAGLMYRSMRVGRLTSEQHTAAMKRYSALSWRNGEPRPAGAVHEQPTRLSLALGVLRDKGLTLGGRRCGDRRRALPCTVTRR